MPKIPAIPGSHDIIPDGRTNICVQHGAHNDISGLSRAFVAPETAIRIGDIHKITSGSTDTASNSFMKILPLVYANEGARDRAETRRDGLFPEQTIQDIGSGKIRASGSFCFFRPTVPGAPSGLIASLVADGPSASNRRWGEIMNSYPRQIIVTDEGLESESRYPRHLAERIELDGNASDLSLVVVEPEDGSENLMPVLWDPRSNHESGITVGMVEFDPVQLTLDGLVNWTTIGATIYGPSRSEDLVAGLIVTTSSFSRQDMSRRPFDSVRQPTGFGPNNVRNIR